MRGVVLFLVVLIAAISSSQQNSDSDLQKEFEAYKAKYNKHYDSEAENRYRLKLYAESKKMVAKQNDLYNKGLSTWKAGINKFSDLEPSEMPLGLLPPNKNMALL